MHTYGVFLNPGESILAYMDRFNVEKAVITTINRTKFHKNQNDPPANADDRDDMTKFLENFRRRMPKGQLSHEDVIEIANKAPNRIYKFFWFNPKLEPGEEEANYKVLENHFRKGFYGVKTHTAFNLFNFPKDIIKLVSFMQDFDKNLIFFIHSLPKTSLVRGIYPKDIAKLAKRFPDLRIIVGHAAFCMEFAMEVGVTLKNFKNVFFETSCSVSFGIYNLIKTVDHRRILYGSDSPTASTLPIEIDKILTLPKISREQKQDILYNNVNNLINT
ncbi:MAG: amidohydrolase family protein [Promethearchaeota archaeon]